MRPVFADPKTDLIFKRIFGQPAHKGCLIALLNDLLELPEARLIEDVEYLSPEQVPMVLEQKRSIVDVKCTDRTGTTYVVEMQVLNVEGFEKRLIYNAAKAYVGQLRSGDTYPGLNDVIAVAICDFELWPDGQRPEGSPAIPLLSQFEMREVHSGAHAFGQLRLVVLELPKYRGGDRPATTVERWAYFFRECERLSAIPAVLALPPFAEVLDLARISALSEAEYDRYERELMAETDSRQAIVKADRIGAARGRAEGRSEGRAEGAALALQDAVLKLLEHRGPVDPEVRARVASCQDLAVLRQWLVPAATGALPAE